MQERWLRGGVALVGVAAVVAASGCGAPQGNGKRGELQFGLRDGRVAAGLETQAMLLRRSRVDTWDFHGATVEVSGPEGVVLDPTPPLKAGTGDYPLRLRCPAEADGPQEVRVRVMDGGQPRYEDAFDLDCVQPTELRLSLVQGVSMGPWVVGATTPPHVHVELRAGGEPLLGEGLTLSEDGGGVELELSLSSEHKAAAGVRLTPRAPASFVRLRSGKVTADVPMRVLDDSEWTLELERSATFAEHTYTGRARHLDGTPVFGLAGYLMCEVTTHFVDGSSHTRRDNCSAYAPADRVARACLRVRGNEACGDGF